MAAIENAPRCMSAIDICVLYKVYVYVCHWERINWKGKAVLGFLLSLNSFFKQMFLAIFVRQPQCHIAVLLYLLACMDQASYSHSVLCECLLLLLLCFLFPPLVLFPPVCLFIF